MGLFSSNRISSIAVDESAEEVLEVQEENAAPSNDASTDQSATDNQSDAEAKDQNDNSSKEVVKEPTVESAEEVDTEDDSDEEFEDIEIDADVEDMLDGEDYDIDENYFDSVTISEGFNDILSSCININENDKNMFEALIELDFVSLCKEHTLGIEKTLEESAPANDAKKENIEKNTTKVLVGMENTVLQAGAVLAKKANTILASDTKILNKFVKSISEENALEGFAGLNIAFPTKESAHYIDKAADIRSIQKIVSEAFDNILVAENKEAVDCEVNIVREKFDKESDDFTNDIEKAMKVAEGWLPSIDDINFMDKFANESLVVDAIANGTKNILSELSDIEIDATSAINLIEGSDELSVYKANKIYNIASAAAKVTGKKFQVFNDLTIREMASIRKAILGCGAYASNKAITEETLNSICESSDAHVFDYFE